MRFIGLELSWTPKRSSCLAVAEGDEFGLRLEHLKIIKSDEDIVHEIEAAIDGKPVLVAIDAPLISPKRRRRCDGLIDVLFSHFSGESKAGIARLGSWQGNQRGAVVAQALAGVGIAHNPHLKAFERSRKCFEVLPYPSMFVIFGPDDGFAYKHAKRLEARREGLKLFQQHLGKVADLHLEKGFLSLDIASLKGESLNEYGGKLDALFCAYIAYYAWKRPERCEVLGDMRDGCILTPVLRKS